MEDYYVNKNTQKTGEHEVHTGSCYRLPNTMNRIYLGNLQSSKEALKRHKNTTMILMDAIIVVQKYIRSK